MAPAIIGFNLENMIFKGLEERDVAFLSVNLKNTDWSDARFIRVHFEDCNLSGIRTDERTIIRGCSFKRCVGEYDKVGFAEALESGRAFRDYDDGFCR